MTLARKLEGQTRAPNQDGSVADRLFHLARKGVQTLRLSPTVSVERCVLVEIQKPPQVTRGLADLVVRRALEADIPALVKLDQRDAAVFRGRLDRGDLLYLGQLEADVVCCTCFHQGPSPFDDERATLARWALEDAATFWSYDAMAPLEMRSAGVVAKLFQIALRDVFGAHGARLVRGFIHDWNLPSLLLHERLGFTTVGRATAIAFPGLKWLRWESGGGTRQWLLRRSSAFALPPAES